MNMQHLIPFTSRLVLVLAGALMQPDPSLAQPSAKMDCAMATKIAAKAYDRAINEKRKNNLPVAYVLRVSFWDLYGYATHCPDVERLAVALKANNLGMDSTPPDPFGASSTSEAGTATRYVVQCPPFCPPAGASANHRGHIPEYAPAQPGFGGSLHRGAPSQ